MTSSLWIHPSLVLLTGALLLSVIPDRLRKAWMLLVPALAFVTVFTMPPGTFGVVPLLGQTLVLGRVDALSNVFAYIMTLMSIIGSLYGLHVPRRGETIAAWVYVAGSLGVLYAGDLLTLFLFWELMAFSSVFLIWFRGRSASLWAGYRYLLVHVVGGLFLLSGIVLHFQSTGTLAFNGFDVTHMTTATWLILLGFMLNAAVPPLHAWLPDAYSEATFNGSVFLCAFTTKTAVYTLCRGFAGLDILIPLGVVMALYGVVYALLANDSRRLLAYDIISKVGYMVVGVGLGTELAINGVCALAFAHILYKGLLFMGCGSVLHMTGRSKFTELGGLWERMPGTLLFTIIGGLATSAFPLFSGFVSKSMIVDAGFEHHHLWAGFLLLVASAGAFLNTGLKLPYFIWFGKNNCSADTWQRAGDPPWNMNLAMAAAAALCIFIGCYTPYLYQMLPYPVEFEPYTSYHVSETLQILLFTALGFFLLVPKLTPTEELTLDVDWFYRKGGRAFLWLARKPIQLIDTAVCEAYRWAGLIPLMFTARAAGRFDNGVIDGLVDGLARTVANAGHKLRSLQRGRMQQGLAITFLVAAIIVLVILFISRRAAP